MDYPDFPSHLVPRSRTGRRVLTLFLLLFLLAEPPLLFAFANRVEPWLLGHPFLYTYLGAVYLALIAVLFYAHWRRL